LEHASKQHASDVHELKGRSIDAALAVQSRDESLLSLLSAPTDKAQLRYAKPLSEKAYYKHKYSGMAERACLHSFDIGNTVALV